MNKYFLVFLLLLISITITWAGGPAPQIIIDTDQIVDGAVTAIKTDGSLATSDLSNVPATATLTIASATIPVLEGVTTINDVTPLTAAQTASATNLGTIASQNADAVAITGGVATLTAAEITHLDNTTASITDSLTVPAITGVNTLNGVTNVIPLLCFISQEINHIFVCHWLPKI